MGSHRAKVLILLAGLALPASAEEPGWHYSPLPGEGDRATLGCDREAAPETFTCLAVRCEDDFTTGVYVHSYRPDDTGAWEMTIDRENRTPLAEATDAPYGARFLADGDWLLDRLRQGSFVYLRPADAGGQPFAFIDLTGSLLAINRALAWCAPRVPAGEPITAPDV